MLTALEARLAPEIPTAYPADQPPPAATPTLTAAELATLRAVFAQVPGLEKVGLFGSRAKGTHRPASDIDLALFGALNRDALALAARQFDESLLLYHVDLLPHRDIDNPELLAHIEQVGVVVS